MSRSLTALSSVLVLSSSFLAACSGDAGGASSATDAAPTDTGIASDTAPPPPPAPKGVWARTIGSDGPNSVRKVIVDAGNTFVLGDVQSGTGLDGDVNMIGGARGTYLAQLNVNGKGVWTSYLGPHIGACDVALTEGSDGLLVLACWTEVPVYLGLDTTIPSGVSVYAFWANSGKIAWQHSFGRAVPGKVSVAGDANGDVAIAVGGDATASLIAKLNRKGDLVFSKTVGHSSSLLVGMDDLGAVYVAGSITDRSMDLGGGPIPNGGADVFEGKLDPAGRYAWSANQGGAGVQALQALAVDGDHIVIASNELEAPMLSPRALRLAAFGAATGAPLWTWENPKVTTFRALTAAKGTTVLGFGVDVGTRATIGGRSLGGDDQRDDGLVALDTNGKETWARLVGLTSGTMTTAAMAPGGGVRIGAKFTEDFQFDTGVVNAPALKWQDDGVVAWYAP